MDSESACGGGRGRGDLRRAQHAGVIAGQTTAGVTAGQAAAGRAHVSFCKDSSPDGSAGQATAGRAHVSFCKDSSPDGSGGSQQDDHVHSSRAGINPSPSLKTESPEVIQGDVLHISQHPPPILDRVLSKLGRNPCVIIYNSSMMKFQTTEETTSVGRPEKRHRSSSRESSSSSHLHQQPHQQHQERENRDPRISNRKYKDLPYAKKQKFNVPSTIISPPPPLPPSPGCEQQLGTRQSSDISPPSTVESVGMDVVTSFTNIGTKKQKVNLASPPPPQPSPGYKKEQGTPQSSDISPPSTVESVGMDVVTSFANIVIQ